MTTLQRYAENVGGSTSVTVSHNLGTKDVVVEVYDNTTPYAAVDCEVERPDTTSITLKFASAPSAGQYRCVVMG